MLYSESQQKETKITLSHHSVMPDPNTAYLTAFDT
jgi:hypothetical protein